jgi:hypothetical protein
MTIKTATMAGWLHNITLPGIVKVFFVAGLLMYCIFAIVVIRQAEVMSETIEARYNNSVKIAAGLHLLMAVGILIVAIMML